MKCLDAVAVAALLLSMPVPEARAACANAKCSDSAAIDSARGTIQTTCGCTRRGLTHSEYEQCVKRTLKAPNMTALIPQKACRSLIMKCENASICGVSTTNCVVLSGSITRLANPPVAAGSIRPHRMSFVTGAASKTDATWGSSPPM